jgi:cytidylate kinase
VAQRLGVEFLDRALPAAVARHMDLPEAVAEARDEQPQSAMSRLIDTLAQVAPPSGNEPADRRELDERAAQARVEEVLVRTAASGAVILGRGGAVVLGRVPGALHVFLRGSRDARMRQAMTLDNVDRDTAERRLEANDRARREYVRRSYGVDGDDPSLYHLVIDSCAFDLDACVNFIVTASQLRMQQAQS